MVFAGWGLSSCLCLAIVVCVAHDDLSRGNVGESIRWRDWDGLQVCYPTDVLAPNSESEVVDIIKNASNRGWQVKVVGSGHSFSSIALTDPATANDAFIMSLDKLDSVPDINFNAMTVTVEAGIRVHALNDQLLAAGLSLPNTGAIAIQSVAGATQTSTHGTGRKLGSMSAGITAMRMVLSNGTALDLDQGRQRDRTLLQAARVGLGALGVVTEVTLKVVPAFKLRRTVVTMALDDLIAKLPQLNRDYERLQWYYTPYTNTASLLLREVVDINTPIEPCWPLEQHIATSVTTPNVTCVDWSYKALCHEADDAIVYTEMEYFVPAAKGGEIIASYRSYQDSIKTTVGDPCNARPDCSLFTGVRYVSADDSWMSPMHNRDIAVVSTIVFGTSSVTGPRSVFEAYAQGLEAIAQSMGGRPHWGKQHWADYSYLRTVYPRLEDFAALVRQMDPTGTFKNDFLRRSLGE